MLDLTSVRLLVDGIGNVVQRCSADRLSGHYGGGCHSGGLTPPLSPRTLPRALQNAVSKRCIDLLPGLGRTRSRSSFEKAGSNIWSQIVSLVKSKPDTSADARWSVPTEIPSPGDHCGKLRRSCSSRIYTLTVRKYVFTDKTGDEYDRNRNQWTG